MGNDNDYSVIFCFVDVYESFSRYVLVEFLNCEFPSFWSSTIDADLQRRLGMNEIHRVHERQRDGESFCLFAKCARKYYINFDLTFWKMII